MSIALAPEHVHRYCNCLLSKGYLLDVQRAEPVSQHSVRDIGVHDFSRVYNAQLLQLLPTFRISSCNWCCFARMYQFSSGITIRSLSIYSLQLLLRPSRGGNLGYIRKGTEPRSLKGGCIRNFPSNVKFMQMSSKHNPP